MNSFKQHIPTFVEIDEPPPIYEFKTTEELLALKVVQQYKDKDFSYFALSGNCLMVVSKKGFHWWAVGYIKDPEAVDLPKWSGGQYRAKLPNGKKVILQNKEVISICGDVLTLRDKTKARRINV